MTLIKGKVKTVYETDNPNEVVIHYEDRVTAGNGRKELWIEDKGAVCCQISRILFNVLEQRGIRTHYITMPNNNSMCCTKLDIIPIEVVVRNIAAGSIVRQTTIEEGTEFEHPLVEFYLKDDEKDDPLLTDDRVIIMGYGMIIQQLDDIAREVNSVLRGIFNQMDLTLVDFKLEFGYDANDNLVLGDELSPDGMRLWRDGISFDKDLFRKENGNIMSAYKYILEELGG
tara:strand:- start:1570 stop:2253 length:684 start_codon:yes stop_codon:yes gene_type:complete